MRITNNIDSTYKNITLNITGNSSEYGNGFHDNSLTFVSDSLLNMTAG